VVKPLVAEPYNLEVAVVTLIRLLIIGLVVVLLCHQQQLNTLLLVVVVEEEAITALTLTVVAVVQVDL
jgi:hypothetical protein